MKLETIHLWYQLSHDARIPFTIDNPALAVRELERWWALPSPPASRS